MTDMTFTTIHTTMLTWGLGPRLIHTIMAGATGGVPLITFIISNLQRHMHRMAGQTRSILLTFKMGFMTFHTGRDKAMLGMTGPAALLGMLAGILLKLTIRAGMTSAAGLFNIGQRYCQGSMGVLMTVQTTGKLISMG